MNKKKGSSKNSTNFNSFLRIMSKIQIGRKNKYQKNLPLLLLL